MHHNVNADCWQKAACLPGINAKLGGIRKVVLGLGQGHEAFFHDILVANMETLGPIA